MNLKKAGIILFLIFSLLPVSKTFAQATNAGFVPSNIWYSKDPFEEGDKIKIYTLIFNPDTRKFSGTVDFFDNEKLLGTKDFSIAGTSTKDISINWTVTAGSHQIFGRIKNAKFLTTSGVYKTITLIDGETTKSSRTVSSKIIAQKINNSINTVDGAFNDAINSIQNIGDTAKKNVPASISQSVAITTSTVDSFRKNTSTSLKGEQEKAQNKINSLNSTKSPVNTNNIQKPFEYVALFFFSILAAIFKYGILFYGILAFIAFLLVRYIWSLIF